MTTLFSNLLILCFPVYVQGVPSYAANFSGGYNATKERVFLN